MGFVEAALIMVQSLSQQALADRNGQISLLPGGSCTKAQLTTGATVIECLRLLMNAKIDHLESCSPAQDDNEKEALVQAIKLLSDCAERAEAMLRHQSWKFT